MSMVEDATGQKNKKGMAKIGSSVHDAGVKVTKFAGKGIDAVK